MNARTRLLVLLVASASLGSCVAPPPPMPPDPALSSSTPRHAAPASTATPRPAPRSAAARAPGLRLGDNVGVTGLFGRRSINDLEPADNHLVLGLEVDAYDEFSFLGFEGGFLFSDDSSQQDGEKTEFDVLELYAGVRKTFTAADGRLHPYLSAGLAYLDLNASHTDPAPPEIDDNDSFGLYLRAGAYYRPTDMLRIGVDFRRMLATHLSGTGGQDLDYSMLALAIGVSF